MYRLRIRSSRFLLRSSRDRALQWTPSANCLKPKEFSLKRYYSSHEAVPDNLLSAVPREVLDRRHAALVEAALNVKKTEGILGAILCSFWSC